MKQTMSATLATSQFHHEIGDALQNAMRVQKALHVKRNLLADMNTYTRLPPPPLQKTVSLPPALPSARSTLNAVPSIDNNNNYSIYSDPIALSSSSLSSTTSDSPQQSPSSGSQQLNSSRYKTELCRSHAETGDCKYGEKCQFAHGVSDLRDVQRHPKYKTELCRSYHSSAAYCQYGNRCNFIHREDKRQATAQQNISAVGAQRPQTLPHDLEIGIFDVSMVNNMPQRGMSLGSTGDSPAGSIAAESPTASPTWPSNSDYFNSPLLSQSPPSVNYMQSPEPYVFSDAQTVVEPQRSQQYMSALPTQKTTPNTDDINELAASLSRAASLRTNTDSFVGPYGPHVLPPSPTTSSADREVANLTPVEVDIALQYLNNLRQLERRQLPSQQYPFA